MALVPIQKELDLDDTQMGIVLAAFTVAYGLFEIPTGHWGDRIGPRAVLTRIAIWWSIFTVLTGLIWSFEWNWSIGPVALVFNSFLWMVLVRFLFGMGEAGAYPNIARGLRNWFPYERRGLAQGLMWMFARWGGAAAPPMIALFAAPWGWRGPTRAWSSRLFARRRRGVCRLQSPRQPPGGRRLGW